MAEKHPYISAPGNLVKVVLQFRRSFPGTVTAETLKKLGFAPKNESYVLNVLRFLGLIDADGKKTEAASATFSLHDDAGFAQEFGKLVTTAYAGLFELHGDGAWDLDTNSLIAFFRSADETTAIVGRLQSTTFRVLAGFSGHGDLPTQKPGLSKTTVRPAKGGSRAEDKEALGHPKVPSGGAGEKRSDVRKLGLTVRIEINLPADGDQETYNRIFRSIRENFLNE